MHVKAKRIIAIIFIVCIVVSEICMGEIFADSFDVRTFVADEDLDYCQTPTDSASQNICVSDAVIRRGESFYQLSVSRKGQRRNPKTSSLLLCADTQTESLSHIYLTVGIRPDNEGESAAVILHFIHEKDGKKRA